MKFKSLVFFSKKHFLLLTVLAGFIVLILLPPIERAYKVELEQILNYPDNQIQIPYSSSGIKDLTLQRNGTTSLTVLKQNTNKDSLHSEAVRAMYIRSPHRNMIYLGDLDSDSTIEAAWCSQEDDSIFLHIANAERKEIEKSIFLEKTKSRLIINELWYCKRKDDLYFFTVTESKLEPFSSFYKYNYIDNSLKCLWQSSLGEMHCTAFKDHPDKILFYNSLHHYTAFFSIYDISTENILFPVTTLNNTHFKIPFYLHIPQYPYRPHANFLFNSDAHTLIDIDTLMTKGKVLNVPISSNKNCSIHRILYAKGDILFFANKKKQIYKYNSKNKHLKRIKTPKDFNIRTILYYGDIDKNGNNDICYTNIDKRHTAICIQEEKKPWNISSYPISREKLYIHNILHTEKNRLRFNGLSTRGQIYYGRNPDYYKNFLWKALILASLYMIALLIKKTKETQEYRKRDTENKILQLQLENVQKRIDPHFIFNSLNNLGSLILDGNTNDGYDYLSKVSEILHKALKNKSILVSTENELSFCVKVLEAQKQRFIDKFQYEITIDKDADLEQKIPSNILNSMADNCIKHGFIGIDYLGLISIEIQKRDKGTLLIVQDNGIGRVSSKGLRNKAQSTGTGLDICEKYITLFNQGRKNNLLYFKITDLYNNEDVATGTRCEFYVPNGLKNI